ncbi:hypothetical protein GGI25_000247 [Coemansia spiralis]|uniref:WD40 repeat-like protein n=2 Tax=Coemansia TaxID=4863 RepID=A0A9W8GF53_9FUNG|nr:hypothetical protein EDC05_000536 [Coemansia umbellata]KAJ2625821.1 hypothetical protein GGI26_000282 [Coemansia sp. RSA 1358]KAJ2680943.1 hypothetical protein GGI25_000247 [Coemansia spiralis]
MSIPFVAPLNYARAKENRPHRFAYDYGSVDPGMFTPTPERSRPKRAPKRTIAYTIPLPNIHSQDGQTVHQPQGHVLGVNALALSLDANGSDIEGAETATGGLLFSGGRDGVVKAWNLNFPLKRSWKSTVDSGVHSGLTSNSFVGSDTPTWSISRHKARHSRPQTALRASRTMHSNWVNDIVLLNGSKTVVSASSDLTVRAWAPHCPDERPYTIGSHMDYVKALAYSEHRQMVISGGLDRKIKLWDVGEGRHSSGPICALQEFGDASVSSSVYTLACNTQGTLVVSGSPEKFIRIWDTRAGRQLTTLSGHTDHIRAVLLSADSELVLSGSSDTTVKLWSMRMRRCLSTYSHHTDSVWSLYTSHPRFQTFYSASRDGLVAKTVGAGMHADEWMSTNRRTSLTPAPRSTAAAAVQLGAAAAAHDAHYLSSAVEDTLSAAGVVCVAVAKEPQGVVKLVAADDAYIWTATKGTGLNRWLDVSIRAHHESRQCGVSSTSHQPYSMQAQPRLNSTASALQNKGAGDRSAADAVNYAAGSNAGGDSEESLSDSEEFASVTRNSLIEPWQSIIFDGSNEIQLNDYLSGTLSQNNPFNHSSHGNKNTALHRRNRTVDYGRQHSFTPTAPYQSALRNTVSPVLKAMQAEQARRNVIRESDSEAILQDAHVLSGSNGSDGISFESSAHSPPPRLNHVRSRSTGCEQERPLGSITAVLTGEIKDPVKPIAIPGKTSVPVLRSDAPNPFLVTDLDTVSISDSPLPSASLINTNHLASPTSATSSVTTGLPIPSSQYLQSNKERAKAGAEAQRSTEENREVVPVRSKPDETIQGQHGLHRHKILPNKRQVLAQDTQGRVSLWDIMLCKRIYEFPETNEEAKNSSMFRGISGKDFDSIEAHLSVNPESVNMWCQIDTRIGALTVRLDESRAWSAEVHVDEVDGITPEVIQAMGDHERVNIGQWMVKRLFLNYARARVKRGSISARDAARLNRWAAQIPAGEIVSARVANQQQAQSSYAAQQSQKGAPPGMGRSATALGTTARLPSLAGASSKPLEAPKLHITSSEVMLNEQQQQQQHQSSVIASPLVDNTERIGIGSSVAQPSSGNAMTQQSGKPASNNPFLQNQSTKPDDLNGSRERADSGSGNSSADSASRYSSQDATADADHTGKQAVRAPSIPRHHHSVSIDTAPSTPQTATSQQQQQQQQQQQSAKSDDGESANSNGSTGKFMNRLLSMRVRRQKSVISTQATAGANSNKLATASISSGSTTSNGGSTSVTGMDKAIPNGTGGSLLSVPALPTANRSNSTPDTLASGLKSGQQAFGAAAQAAAPSPRKEDNALGKPQGNNLPAARSERDEFAEWAGPRFPTDTERTLALLQCTPAPWEQLYSPVVCPRLPLPRNVIVQICQDHVDASEPYSIYRNTIDNIASPPSYQANATSIFRVTDDPLLSFELCMPAWLTDFLLFNRLPASYQEPAKVSFVLSPMASSTLPPFPNPNARLVANCMLRARKLAIYVVDKLGLPLMQQPPPNYVSAVDACVSAYTKMLKSKQGDSDLAVGSMPANNGAGNKYIDLFTDAGEVLADAEQAALADMLCWRNSINIGDSDGSEYIGHPELYLDLFSKEVKLHPKQTLATIKTNVWKANGDIQVYYEWAAFVKKRISIAQSLASKV